MKRQLGTGSGQLPVTSGKVVQPLCGVWLPLILLRVRGAGCGTRVRRTRARLGHELNKTEVDIWQARIEKPVTDTGHIRCFVPCRVIYI